MARLLARRAFTVELVAARHSEHIVDKPTNDPPPVDIHKSLCTYSPWLDPNLSNKLRELLNKWMWDRYPRLVFIISGKADLISSCRPVNHVYGQILSDFSHECDD